MPTGTLELGDAGTHTVDLGLWDYIVKGARQRNLDPWAVLSVWLGEGGIRRGARGDYSGQRPTSFGPAQLHERGALPARYNGNPAAAQAFADSPAGIDYALDQVAKVAAGLTGPAAVDAIVRRFEIPADPDRSVRNALQRLDRIESAARALPASSSTDPAAFFPFPGGSLPSNPEAPGKVAGAVGDAIGGPVLTAVAYAGLTLLGLALIFTGLLRALGTSPLELARGRAARAAYDAELDDEIPF